MNGTLLRSACGEVRSGWKILVFVVLASALGLGGLLFLKSVGAGGGMPSFLAILLAVLAASAVMTRVFHRKPLRAIGLGVHEGTPREIAQGLIHGFLMMGLLFVAQVPFGWVDADWMPGTVGALAGAVALAGIQFLVAAFFEEVLFRGYLYQVLTQGITVIPSTLLLSVVFAVAHGGNPNIGPIALVNIALAGVWLSLAYLRTRSLWYPTALHVSWNFTQTVVFGFPTSGMAPSGNTVVLLDATGPAWLTGGAFGPEGGLLATAVLLAASWYVFRTPTLYAPHDLVTLETPAV